ncbi:MAG: TetR/AcrR family transcriptional regulator [Eubacteriaceae bacterium]|nr:TetR/AcrR family transcriptional regulator [Eubacteriaceae bacterium]
MTKIKRTNREIESQKKKKKIADEAIKLFVQNGYDRITVADISDATGFSVGSIYNFFGNKGGILSNSIKSIYRTAAEQMVLDSDRMEDPKNILLKYYRQIADELDRYGREIAKEAMEATSTEYRSGGNLEYRDVSLQAIISLFQIIEKSGEWKCKEPVEAVAEQIQMEYMGIVCTWIYFPLHESLREALDYNLLPLLDKYDL